MSLNLNIKTVKGNLQRLFDKNLTDLVRGLRNNKENEVFFNIQLMKKDIHIIKIFSSNIHSSFLHLSFLGKLHCSMHRRNQAGIADRQHKCKMQCRRKIDLCEFDNKNIHFSLCLDKASKSFE